MVVCVRWMLTFNSYMQSKFCAPGRHVMMVLTIVVADCCSGVAHGMRYSAEGSSAVVCRVGR